MYLVDEALDEKDDHHEHCMIDEDHVCEHDGACPSVVGEAPEGEVDGVVDECSAGECEVAEGVALDSKLNNKVRF